MAEEEKTEDTQEEVEVPEKFEDIVEQIEEMSVLDLSELVSILEDKFGVSAAAPVAAAPAGGDSGGGDEGGEEQTEFDVELESFGDAKIQVIKAVKSATGQGLADAKSLVDDAPSIIKEGLDKEEAEELKEELEDAGATVNLK